MSAFFLLLNMRIFLFIGVLLISACSKDPGIGGFAEVSGVVWVEDWNASFTAIQSTYPAMDEDVFLVFGDELVVGEDTKTNFNGNYRFKFLYPGKYKLYAYSDRLETVGNTNQQEPVIIEFEITEKYQKLQLDTLVVKR